MRKNIFWLRGLILVNLLVIIAAGFMMPLWSNFVQHIGGDLRTAGNAIAIFSVVIGLVTCIAGHIESRLQKDALFLVLSQLVLCLGYLGYFFVAHPWQLYLVQVILGVGGAFQSPVLCALYHQHIPSHQSAHYWGIWNGFYQIAIGIGALFGAYVAHHFGFYWMFVGLEIVSLLCLVWSCYLAFLLKKESFHD